eukprot:TRINITY_DN19322_c0_g1_i2.p1 TRINITY_DN19322_c0_g1~~TRINITY_DN19322_c0_g1_i2.p1  ORF type:complete len:190 (+),score=26.32 TRINITY_DN19322_c0_g1_i2:213-782(+)
MQLLEDDQQAASNKRRRQARKAKSLFAFRAAAADSAEDDGVKLPALFEHAVMGDDDSDRDTEEEEAMEHRILESPYLGALGGTRKTKTWRRDTERRQQMLSDSISAHVHRLKDSHRPQPQPKKKAPSSRYECLRDSAAPSDSLPASGKRDRTNAQQETLPRNPQLQPHRLRRAAHQHFADSGVFQISFL